jgi:hypothetical protein
MAEQPWIDYESFRICLAGMLSDPRLFESPKYFMRGIFRCLCEIRAEDATHPRCSKYKFMIELLQAAIQLGDNLNTYKIFSLITIHNTHIYQNVCKKMPHSGSPISKIKRGRDG